MQFSSLSSLYWEALHLGSDKQLARRSNILQLWHRENLILKGERQFIEGLKIETKSFWVRQNLQKMFGLKYS